MAKAGSHYKRVPFSANGNPMQNVFFLDSINGFGSNDVISKTTDGGKSWTGLSNPSYPYQYYARQMYFFNMQTGLVMDNATVYKTVNGGASWTKVLDVHEHSGLRDFTFTSDGKGFAVGTEGLLYVSTITEIAGCCKTSTQ
jgi:photosystem II stability/assembly factor-like uncharacterized protein